MAISTNVGYLCSWQERLFSLGSKVGSYFPKKKNKFLLRVFSGIHLIPYQISIKNQKNWSTDRMNFEVHLQNITYMYWNALSNYTEL